MTEKLRADPDFWEQRMTINGSNKVKNTQRGASIHLRLWYWSRSGFHEAKALHSQMGRIEVQEVREMRSMYGVFSKRRTFVRWPSGYDNTVAPFSRPPATQKVKASRVVFSGAVAHCLILYCICQMSLFSLVVVSCSATLISLVLYLALAACFETPSNSED